MSFAMTSICYKLATLINLTWPGVVVYCRCQHSMQNCSADMIKQHVTWPARPSVYIPIYSFE